MIGWMLTLRLLSLGKLRKTPPLMDFGPAPGQDIGTFDFMSVATVKGKVSHVSNVSDDRFLT